MQNLRTWNLKFLEDIRQEKINKRKDDCDESIVSKRKPT